MGFLHTNLFLGTTQAYPVFLTTNYLHCHQRPQVKWLLVKLIASEQPEWLTSKQKIQKELQEL